MILVYGPFFIPPLSYFAADSLFSIFLPLNYCEAWNIIGAGIAAIIQTVKFYIVIFLIFFYAIKIEIMKFKGDFAVPDEDERKLFLEQVIERSL